MLMSPHVDHDLPQGKSRRHKYAAVLLANQYMCPLSFPGVVARNKTASLLQRCPLQAGAMAATTNV